MAVADASINSTSGQPAGDKEEVIKRQQKENEQAKELDSLIKEEVSNGNVYDALTNFLLADPDRQIPQLGGIESQLSQGEDAKRKGELNVARSRYETAAKIEIYNKNKEEARKYLDLADKATEPSDIRHHEMHTVLISNMDEVMRISEDYYGKMAAQHEQDIT
jgi:hypothetical protein